MKPADGFLNTRQAAAYIGYSPAPEFDADGKRNLARSDLAIKAFYEYVTRHGVTKHRRGRCLLFTRVDLDRAIGRSTDEHDDQRRTRMERMAQLARQHAAGEDVHA
jgi:hypothetical protein